jgi:ribose/xylose/arabinose/galactoside ABC-type transport system permease subunit
MMTIAKNVFNKYRILLLAAGIFIVMSLLNEYFFTENNIYGLFDSFPAYGIMAVGLTFVMICGQLDISMGSVAALTACTFMMMVPTAGFILSMLVSLTMGCVLGAFTGFFVSFFRLSPFIVSMTMQLAYKGIALTMTNSTPVSVQHPVLVSISEMQIGPIPLTFFLFLLVVVIAQFVLTRTQYGRSLYIIGGNINVADNLGLNVRGHLWSVFIVQGFCAALGGLVLMTRMFSASGNLAMDAPLSVIPMVIVGGTAFSGGKGGALNTLYGVLLMNIVYNAMSMFSIYANIQSLIKGVILLIIIVSDKYMENRNQKI